MARTIAARLADLVLATECGACHRPGVRWCARCALALQRLELGPAPVLVRPRPMPRHLPPTYAAVAYADPVRAAVTAWKDADRRDLASVLGPLLGRSVEAAVEGAVEGAVEAAAGATRAAGAVGRARGPTLVVPAPSSAASRRRRGDAPLHDLARWVVSQPGREGWRVVPALQHGRRVADQAGLTIAERRCNLAGALAVKPLWRNVIRDRDLVVVDDVVTTGATISEAARALRRAGALGVVGAAIAAAQRHEEVQTVRPL